MSRFIRRVLLPSAGVAVAFASVGRAESGESRSRTEGHGGTAVYLQGGFSTATPHLRGGTVGGSVLIALGQRLAVEGSGAYLDRGAGASAASFSGGVVWNVVSQGERAVPYLVGGLALSRAWFDTRGARFSGPAPSGEMGNGRYRHVMDGGPSGWELGALPPFYGDRARRAIARDGRSGDSSFDDVGLAVGGGVRIRLGEAWSAREDARVLLPTRGGRVYTVWTFTVQLGRRF